MVLRSANKVVRRCPRCGDRAPKDLVEGELRVYWARAAALALLTAGLGLLLTGLWLGHPAQAHCAACGAVFDV